jgi:hypothetical protein
LAFSSSDAHFIRFARYRLLAVVGPGDRTNLKPCL